MTLRRAALGVISAAVLANGALPGGGVVSGALHPFEAIEHIVLLLALGLLAVRLDPRAMWVAGSWLAAVAFRPVALVLGPQGLAT